MAVKILGIVLGVILLLMAAFFGTYNSLKSAEIKVAAQYGQVENQMQRRGDLIPNLVATVKGYAAHEEKIIQDVTAARTKLAGAQDLGSMDAANQELTAALGRLLVVMEAYPDLKANQQYLELMRELAGSENRIAVARRDYNEAVREYNVKIQTFPGMFFAGSMGLTPKPQFEADPGTTAVPQVAF